MRWAKVFRASSTLCEDSDLVDPELVSEQESFVIILQHKSIFTPQDVEWLESYREFDLDRNEQRVVLLGSDSHLLSTNEILQVTGFVDIDDFRDLYERLGRKGLIYSAKAKPSSGRKRDIGRFRVRPPREVEQHFGELLEALRAIGHAQSLSAEQVKAIRTSLPATNPYKRNPDWALQAVGLIDGKRRILPKAVTYAPELAGNGGESKDRTRGVVKVIKAGGFGFIRGDDGLDYFFHQTSLPEQISWTSVRRGQVVSFQVNATAGGRLDAAVSVQLEA